MNIYFIRWNCNLFLQAPFGMVWESNFIIMPDGFVVTSTRLPMHHVREV